MRTRLLLAVMLPLMTTSCMELIPRIAPTVEYENGILADYPFSSNFVDVLGSQIHYLDEGEGDVILLLHGNPTSSYLWRNIVPRLSSDYRVIAPDLIGMGNSSKPKIDYTLQVHQRYISTFISMLGLENITMVLHDWGGAIGLNFAKRYPDKVRSIVLMEAVIKPMRWRDADLVSKYMFKKLRDDTSGHQLIIEDNYFIEKMLPMMAGRALSDNEMEHYRKPFPAPADRLPVRQWPLEIPIDGSPERNHVDLADSYHFIKNTPTPIMFIYADPGMIFRRDFVDQLRIDIPDARYEFVGAGLHYLQETSPVKISKVIGDWQSQLQ